MILLPVAFVCILMEGFFSGSEIAVISVNRAQLHYLVEKGSARARSLNRVLENPEWLLATTLIGTNLATVTFNAVATLYVSRRFGIEYEFLTLLVTVPLLLVFGEVLPKAICKHFADRIAASLIYPLRLVSWILSPVVAVMAAIARVAMRISGVESRQSSPLLTREEMRLAMELSRQTDVKAIERRMIDRIFSFSDRKARDIMIPLVRVVSVPERATLAEAASKMRRSGFSRLPVYSGQVFNIGGWINQYDLLLAKDLTRPVREIARRTHFVPEGVLLDRLLVSMQQAGESMVVVVDEYGGAIGIVTMEDILEEVVGEIEDEYDKTASMYRRIDPKHLVVSGRISIEKLNELLPVKVTPGEYETIAGYLATHMQRIPVVGEECRRGKLKFRVLKGTDHSIDEVEIEHP